MCKGTVEECATQLGIKQDTVRWLSSPSYHKRIKEKGNPNWRVAFKLEGDQ